MPPSQSPDLPLRPTPADLHRRGFLRSALATAVGGAGAAVLASCGSRHHQNAAPSSPQATAATATSTPVAAASASTVTPLAANADDALRLLQEGNQRFAANQPARIDDTAERRMAVSTVQRPFATILSCVDSRVPVELIFDRGFGDLVVIRSAGEVLDHSVTGSLEFGVAELNTPLLMVLGHQRCGALTAAVKALDTKNPQPQQGDLGYLVDALTPAVRQVAGQGGDEVTNAVHANVTLTVAQLRKSPVLAQAEREGKAKIVGAYYSLDTGKVEMI